MTSFLHLLPIWFLQIFGVNPLYGTSPSGMPAVTTEESSETNITLIAIPVDRISNGF